MAATIYTTQTLTASGPMDPTKTYVVIDRVADVAGVFVLPDLTSVAPGTLYLAYLKDGFASTVQINTFDGAQKMSGDTSVAMKQYQTLTVIAIDSTLWGLQMP